MGFREAKDHLIVIRGNSVLAYTDETARRNAVCFRSEKQLLSNFKGMQIKDGTFDGFPEASWRYDALYPDPLAEQ